MSDDNTYGISGILGSSKTSLDDAIRTAIKEMHRGGVNIDAAPKEAVEMVIEANRPPDGPALRGRGRRR